MLIVYFDATYNHPKPHSGVPTMHSLGAYISSTENWRKFDKEWRIELNKKGLSHFHMTDFEYALREIKHGRKPPSRNLFKDWKEEDFIPFLQRLHQVINRKEKTGKHRLESWTSTVLKDDFDATIPPELVGDVQCSSYYIFNVVQVLKGINHFLKLNKGDSLIHYVFAGGDGEGSKIDALFKDMWQSPAANSLFRLNKNFAREPYEIKMMKETPALQAADIAAYEMQKFALTVHKYNYPAVLPKDVFRSSLISLGKSHHNSLIYRRAELQRSFSEIIEHNKLRVTHQI